MGAPASDVRKNLNLFVDGRGYAGQVEDVTAPKLQRKTEEFRGGGMNTPVEIPLGTEKLEGGFTLISYSADVLAQFGVAAGNTIPFVIREALESLDGTVTPVVHTMRGTIKEMDPGDSKPGEPAKLKCTLALTYYKLQHGTRVVQEIDPINMVHIVDGVDQLAAQRAALGM